MFWSGVVVAKHAPFSCCDQQGSDASYRNGFDGSVKRGKPWATIIFYSDSNGRAQWLLMQVRWSAALTVASLDGTAKGDRNTSPEESRYLHGLHKYYIK